MKSLFIENTITSKSPFNTGIQRTVRRLIEESNNNIHFKPQIIDLNDINKSSEKKSLIRVPSLLKNIFNIVLNKIGLFEIYSLILFKIDCYKFFRITDVNESYFLNIDANWGQANLHFIDKFKKNGGKVISIYYDNGPYLHPEYFYPDLVINFQKYWNNCFKKSDLILCISKTIRDELIDLINKNIGNNFYNVSIHKIDYFYLGNDHISVEKLNLPLQAKATNNKLNYLVVGSIEPRKNNQYIFDSFENLLTTNPSLKRKLNLIFVYNNYWKQDDLIQQIKSSRFLNKNIYIFDDVNDRELLYLYKSSYALINASHYEGYGLGIAEALSMELKVFCSDISVYREIFSGNVIFFNTSKPEDLNNNILMDLKKGKKLKPAKNISWKSSLDMLLDKLNRI